MVLEGPVARVRDRGVSPAVLVLVAVVVVVAAAAAFSMGGLAGGSGDGPGAVESADRNAATQGVGASVVEDQPDTIEESFLGTNYFSPTIDPGEADRLTVGLAESNTVEADDVKGPAVFLDPEAAGSTPALFVCFRGDVVCPALGETVDISEAEGNVLVAAGVEGSGGQQIAFEHELSDGEDSQTLTTGPTGVGTEPEFSGSVLLTDVEFTETVAPGDNVTISAEVTGLGGRTGSAELSYRIESADVTRSLGDVSLDSGDSTTVERTFENVPEELGAGTYRQRVTVAGDSSSGTLTVRKSGPIEVTVRGEQVDDPIEDVTVRVEHESGTTFNASERGDGTYVVDPSSGPPPGEYTITAEHPDYPTKELTVAGTEDGTPVSAEFAMASSESSVSGGGGDAGLILLGGLVLVLLVLFVFLTVAFVGRSDGRVGTGSGSLLDVLPGIGDDSTSGGGGISLQDDRERSPLLPDKGPASRLRRPWLPASVRDSLGSLLDRGDGDSGGK